MKQCKQYYKRFCPVNGEVKNNVNGTYESPLNLDTEIEDRYNFDFRPIKDSMTAN